MASIQARVYLTMPGVAMKGFRHILCFPSQIFFILSLSSSLNTIKFGNILAQHLPFRSPKEMNIILFLFLKELWVNQTQNSN